MKDQSVFQHVKLGDIAKYQEYGIETVDQHAQHKCKAAIDKEQVASPCHSPSPLDCCFSSLSHRSRHVRDLSRPS